MTFNATIAQATARQPRRFVVFEGKSFDKAQARGEWIASPDPVELRA